MSLCKDLPFSVTTNPVRLLSDDRQANEWNEVSLTIVVPLTSQIRGYCGEIDLGPLKWLPKRSAVNLQGLASFDYHKLTRKIGVLSKPQYDLIKQELGEVLGL